MAAQVEKKPRGRPPKNKDPLGAEEIPEPVLATPAGDAEAKNQELQQMLEMTTEQLRNAHAENVDMRKRLQQLEQQMAAMQTNNDDPYRGLDYQARKVKENETIHEKMNDVLNKLDATPPVIVPEEERQVSCFFTKKNLTLGDEKIYVVQYLPVKNLSNTISLRPKAKTVITSEGQQFRKVNCYEAVIIAQYPDWDTFIEKHGGVAISAAQGKW